MPRIRYRPAADLSTRATLALDNLASVAINTSLISDTDSTDDLGSSSKYFANAYIDKIYLNATATLDGATAGQITLTGNLGLPATTATTGIIYSSANTLLHTYGTNNIFLGVDAGNLTLSGAVNNVGIGDEALVALTSGDSNVAIGYRALYTQAAGLNSVAIGLNALHDANASRNFAIGANAAYFNSAANDNCALGYYALHYNETGSFNVAIGSQAGMGASNQSHEKNTFIGHKAGYAITTGGNNLIAGYQAGIALTSGINNILLGYQAGDNLTTGGSNIIIGYDIDASAVDISNELNIGGLIKGDTNLIKLGFFGVTAAVQQAYTAISDPPTQAEVTAIRDALVNLGLMAAS